MTFDFVNDEQIKEMLKRDYTELQNCFDNKASKSVLILSGSILEAVLIDFFSAKISSANDLAKLHRETLGNLIERANNEKLIDDNHKNFSSGIQGYRNLIHPGREVRLKEKFDYDTASLSFSALKLILKEIEIKSLSEKGRSASEIFNKLTNDGLPDGLFIKITNKLNKTEKNKLFQTLISDDLGNRGPQLVQGASKYAELLSSSMDSNIFLQLTKELMQEIESGSEVKAIKYIRYLYQRLSEYLEIQDLEIVKEWLLTQINSRIAEVNDLRFLMFNNVIDALLRTDKNIAMSPKLKLLAQRLTYYYSYNKNSIIYLDIWTKIHGFLDADAYSELLKQMESYSQFDVLIKDYAEGDYLPF